MAKYILKRIGLMLFTFLVIITICFVLVKLLPNKAPEAFGQDQALIEARREQLGYNKPIMVQYFIFLGRSLLGGDWGISESLYVGTDVMELFSQKLPATVMVNLYSLLLSVPLGLAFGIFAALKKNKWQDHVISTLVMIFISVPSYVYAFLVQYILCFKLGWFPLLVDTGTNFFLPSMVWSMFPAILSLAFGTIAGLTRFTRAELTEVLTSDFMLLARTKGLTKSQATVRHALKNAMVPIFPMIIGEFISILGGSIVIEQIFAVPGVGELYIKAITAATPDYNIFMLLTCFYTFVGLAAGIVIDISYGIIDPRIRMGAR